MSEERELPESMSASEIPSEEKLPVQRKNAYKKITDNLDLCRESLFASEDFDAPAFKCIKTVPLLVDNKKTIRGVFSSAVEIGRAHV